MSDRAPLLRAVRKVRIGMYGGMLAQRLELVCGHALLYHADAPPRCQARCAVCEDEREAQLAREPLPHLRLTHYGL